MMRAAVVGLLLLAGCTAQPTAPTAGEPAYDRAYADGYADGKIAGAADERARAQAILSRVAPYTYPSCDRNESWLNSHGKIPLKRMAKARGREIDLKLWCADKFDMLAGAYRRAVKEISSDQ